jgi:peptidoglycan biosynthesis protein MviN/MurJ (putative lipid II flippase)
MLLDPVVHAALVTVFVFLVNLVFNAIGIDLGNEVATALATVIVGYILSLFGYATYKAIINKSKGLNASTDNYYHPPFT